MKAKPRKAPKKAPSKGRRRKYCLNPACKADMIPRKDAGLLRNDADHCDKKCRQQKDRLAKKRRKKQPA